MIERLLWQGQDHFRRNEITRAEACWRRVLELDPTEARALHLLQSAELSLDTFMVELRAQLQQLFAERRFAEMVDVLASAHERYPGAGGIAELLRLIKKRVVHDCCVAIGSFDRIALPLKVDGRLLTPAALAVAALIDREVSVRTLITQSSLGPFATLLSLYELQQHAALQFADTHAPLEAPSEADVALVLAEPAAPELSLSSGSYARRTKPGYAFKDLPTDAYVPNDRMGTNGFAAQVPDEAAFEAAFNAATEAYLACDYSRAEALYQQCVQQRPDDKRARHNLEVVHRRRDPGCRR